MSRFIAFAFWCACMRRTVDSLELDDSLALDCGVRTMLFKKALGLQPWRGSQIETFDSLLLESLCESIPLPGPPKLSISKKKDQIFQKSELGQVHLRVQSEDDRIPSTYTVQEALHVARNHLRNGTKEVVITLTPGVHFLNETIVLTNEDSGISIVSDPGGMAWLSGARLLTPEKAKWRRTSFRMSTIQSKDIWEADLSVFVSEGDVEALFVFTPADFQRTQRLTRARIPNNAEGDFLQWGYASIGALNFSFPAAAVTEWRRPGKMGLPQFSYVDLSVANPSGVIKNDSSIPAYNTFAVGEGGACGAVWKGNSYWCSNNSAGGWSEVDQECATTGQLQIPVGLDYNESYTESFCCSWADYLANKTNCLSEPPVFSRIANISGALITAWHSQSWATHTFRISSHDRKQHRLGFSAGGQQGGRNWCRCDQCTYAAKWCKQNLVPPQFDDRLISGHWFLENAFELLDAPGEYFFNESTRLLYFIPNGTVPTLMNFTIPVLKTLLRIEGTQEKPARGITISGLGFLHTASTLMDDWEVPSGGDWALQRAGAVVLTGVESVSISDCTFQSLDGNALLLSGYARNTTVQNNTFSQLGQSAIVLWGETDGFDATAGHQPWHTLIDSNYVSEVGILEKQSSAVMQAKACLTTITRNIFFNVPRSAINLNDNLGGGNLIHRNLIWNTCRESGDHGPINSWDRMPFLTTIRYGKPSFESEMTTVTENFILANYGASQGVDNDDGSSNFHIAQNVFYSADGFKMDYVWPYDGQNCINVGSFLPNVGDAYINNTCVSGVSFRTRSSGCGSPLCESPTNTTRNMEIVGTLAQCSPTYMLLQNNSYYSPLANASLLCGDAQLSLLEVQLQFNNDLNSIAAPLPTVPQMLDWVARWIEWN